MATIMPEGENIRKAVKWVCEERLSLPDKNPVTIADEAILKFDLSPLESEFLVRFVSNETC